MTAALVVFILLNCCFNKSVYALEEANVITEFSSEYTVSETNRADVEVNVKFINIGNSPTILTKYDLYIGEGSISEVEVRQGDDTLPFELVESGGVSIRIALGDTLLRDGDEKTVTVKYSVDKFFSRMGGSYDAVIPIFEFNEKSSTQKIVLNLSDKYETVNYSNLDYSLERKETDDFIVTYTDFQDFDHIFISTGERKNYSFNIERKFDNNKEVFVRENLIIPPDLASQSITFSNISPYPDTAYVSDEGNFVLNYDVPPGESVWVRISGLISNSSRKLKDLQLDSLDKELFLDTEVDNYKIKDEDILAEIDNLNENDSGEKIRDSIFNYITTSLELSDSFRDLHSFEYRKGANVALKSYKNASAEDFADSYVGVCRSLDIPARVVAGYVFPFSPSDQNSGMYHVWPQHWKDEYGWVSVDPAYYEFTDYPQRDNVGLNRIIYAVEPDSLEGFDFENISGTIFPTNEVSEVDTEVEINLVSDGAVESGIKEQVVLEIVNRGNTILSDINLENSGGDFSVEYNDIEDNVLILSGDEYSKRINIKYDKWHVSGSKKVKFKLSGKSSGEPVNRDFEEDIKVEPLSWAEPVSWVVTVLLFLLLCLGVYVISRIYMKIKEK